MMAWIKCTDRMPPDKELVLATVKENGKHKDVWPCVQYNKDSKAWEFLEGGAFVAFNTIINPDCYGNYYEVTHWMPWPEPAED